MNATLIEIARRMFHRQLEDYQLDPELLDEAWRDPWVQMFWIRQAGHVIGDYRQLERLS